MSMFDSEQGDVQDPAEPYQADQEVETSDQPEPDSNDNPDAGQVVPGPKSQQRREEQENSGNSES